MARGRINENKNGNNIKELLERIIGKFKSIMYSSLHIICCDG